MNSTSTPSNRKARPSEPVEIAKLKADERCQARAEIRQEVVEEYRELYAADETALPPIEVFEVEARLYVVDGFHRVAAAINAGCKFIRCTIAGKGTIDDAAWHAVAANQKHGLRRSNEDKHAAVRLALDVDCDQSNRVIADHCGVGDQLVSKVRADWEAEHREGSDHVHDHAVDDLTPRNHTDEKTENARRQGHDGKWRKARKPRSEATPETASPMPPEGELYRKAASAVQRVRKEVRALVEDQTAEKALEDAWRRLDDMSTAPCDQCDGGGCKWCDSRGWTTKQDAQATKDKIRSLKISKRARGQA